MTKINVRFTNGTSKLFDGNNIVNSKVLQEISDFCKENNLVTEGFEYVEEEEPANPYMPDPIADKSVIAIHATIHEERGEWLDWWIDADDDGIFLPMEEDKCEKYLQKYSIITVGDKWFSGKDARKAMNECYRQYRKITILDDKDKVVAEIYDRQTMYDCNDSLSGKYRWMSQKFGNVEHTFADVLECAEDGDIFKHNYKGW